MLDCNRSKICRKLKALLNVWLWLARNRNFKVRDYLNKAARYIANHCIEYGIGTLIVGFNLQMKQNINIGSRNNQNFVQIPHSSFRFKLQALCQRYRIKYIEQEESYTSSASFLDGDNIPTYNADNPQEYKFSGKRINRGLYRTENGILVNADVNGAANILRKSNQRVLGRLASGFLANPLRVKIS